MVELRHQGEGTAFLLSGPSRYLGDEMGLGKSKQVIDAAIERYRRGEVACVAVICPASVRSVWDDPDTGQLARWHTEPYISYRYDSRGLRPRARLGDGPGLHWVTAGYELLRSDDRLNDFMRHLRLMGHGRLMLVLDESSKLKTRRAQQTRSAKKLRAVAPYCVMLNGTPIANNLMDLWSQFNILDPVTLGNRKFWDFRNQYAIMGGYYNKQVVGYREPDTTQFLESLRPWVLRREKKDCLDLPPKLFTFVEVPLGLDAWRLYRDMMKTMIAWAENGDALSVAPHGATKVLRLAQLCAGFLGGVDGEGQAVTHEISSEKLNALVDWQGDHPESMIVWCRFIKERERVVRELVAAGRDVVEVRGGQTDLQREEAINHFEQTPGCVLVGQPQAGGWGLNLSSAQTVVYMSNDTNLVTRAQSEDRAHRQGQKGRVTYVDFLAVTPTGGKTVDHLILDALDRKEDLARWTYAKWRAVFGEELAKG